MRTVSLLAAVLLCAVTDARAQVQVTFANVTLHRDEGNTGGIVVGQPDAVFAVMRDAFTSLGFTLKGDEASLRLSAVNQKAVGKIGKKPVSQYLSCGMGLIGPNADNWHVYYTISVAIKKENAAASALAMSFAAEAVDTPNGRRERLPCATTGKLEAELVERLARAFPGQD